LHNIVVHNIYIYTITYISRTYACELHNIIVYNIYTTTHIDGGTRRILRRFIGWVGIKWGSLKAKEALDLKI
jgi:hypothetical protein